MDEDGDEVFSATESLQSELEECRANLLQSAEIGKRLLEENGHLRDEQENTIKQHCVEIQVWEQKNYELQNKLDSLKQEHQWYSEELEHLREENRTQRETLTDRLEAEKNAATSKLQKQISDLQLDLEDAQTSRQQLRSQITELEALLQQKNDFNETLSRTLHTEETRDFQQDLADAREEITAIKGQLIDSKSECEHQKRETEGLRLRLQGKEEEILDLQCKCTSYANSLESVMSYSITKTWDDRDINHSPIQITVGPLDQTNRVKLTITGPFFNDPPNPGGTPGQPFNGLWDYEVGEAFFLNDNNQYLEVEFSPHGQHLLLLLKGVRDAFKTQLPLDYTATITGNTWTGVGYIPVEYFPPKVSKFNAYAIHGSGNNRVYESLYPVPTGKYQNPDFHRLDYFSAIDFQTIVPGNWADGYQSQLWRPVIGILSFDINTTWDGDAVTHDPIHLDIHPSDDKDQVKVVVKGPFFNDPGNPGGVPGQPFDQLWNYEVAEAFFLNNKSQYVELEFSPHGQHLVLLLRDRRDAFKTKLPLNYTATISGNTWEGVAYIPAEYFPQEVSKFNAYAIHGSGNARTYESLYPVPKGKYSDPDFHKLEYFQPINFKEILPSNWASTYTSEAWKPVIATGR